MLQRAECKILARVNSNFFLCVTKRKFLKRFSVAWSMIEMHFSDPIKITYRNAENIFLFVIVRVAYLIILERKVLRYLQFDKGPNKVGFLGLLQPFSNGLKLLNKERGNLIYKANFIIYYMCPVILIIFMLIFWLLLSWINNIYCRTYSILIIFVLIRLRGFIIIIIGWSSNPIFSLIGAIRFIVQSISYEVNFILILFRVIILRESYSLIDLKSFWF